MLAFCDKLTRTPAAMTPEDVASLRDAGFDDRQIHDIVAVTAYYAFVNRLADGLGVALEPGWGAHTPDRVSRRPKEEEEEEEGGGDS